MAAASTTPDQGEEEEDTIIQRRKRQPAASLKLYTENNLPRILILNFLSQFFFLLSEVFKV
jgi:hypothetical protein